MNIYNEITSKNIKTKSNLISLLADHYFNMSEAEPELKHSAKEALELTDYKTLKLIASVLVVIK